MATIDTEIDQGIATLTINQPQARNAMTPAMLDSLLEATQRCADDKAVRCVLVTGYGEQAFCGGGDISGLADSGNGNDNALGQDELVAMLERWSQSVLLLHTMPKPTIAVLNGVAAGAGMGLALSCDLRLGWANSSFITAFAKLGMPGDFGGSYFLTQLLGPAKAREYYFLSERIGAEQALALGLINRMFTTETLTLEANALAQKLAQAPKPMYKAMKANLNAALTQSPVKVLKQEAQAMIECALSEETRQATAEFFKK